MQYLMSTVRCLIGEKGVVFTACACEAHVKLCQHASNLYHASCLGMRLVWLICTDCERPNGSLSAHLLLSCPGRHYQTSLPPVQDRDKHFVTDKFNLTSSSKNAGDGVLARNCKPSGALEFPGANQVVYQTN